MRGRRLTKRMFKPRHMFPLSARVQLPISMPFFIRAGTAATDQTLTTVLGGVFSLNSLAWRPNGPGVSAETTISTGGSAPEWLLKATTSYRRLNVVANASYDQPFFMVNSNSPSVNNGPRVATDTSALHHMMNIYSRYRVRGLRISITLAPVELAATNPLVAPDTGFWDVNLFATDDLHSVNNYDQWVGRWVRPMIRYHPLSKTKTFGNNYSITKPFNISKYYSVRKVYRNSIVKTDQDWIGSCTAGGVGDPALGYGAPTNNVYMGFTLTRFPSITPLLYPTGTNILAGYINFKYDVTFFAPHDEYDFHGPL